MIVVCERPRLAMALVVERFFAHLAADRPAVYADPATALAVDDGRAWVRNAAVGRNVRIEPLATWAAPAWATSATRSGRLVPFPQLGGVVLEDDVHIAAQAMVQRGAIGDTVVRRGAKVGPHVNVGHNAEIGEDCLIAGHAQIGGGVRIGRRTVVWQSAAMANGVTVGEGAVIGMGAMIRPTWATARSGWATPASGCASSIPLAVRSRSRACSQSRLRAFQTSSQGQRRAHSRPTMPVNDRGRRRPAAAPRPGPRPRSRCRAAA